jgi:spoIIIJ-associated protein
MSKVTMKGKNVEDAVAAALEVLGAAREDVDVNVLNEGKGGIMGLFGGQEAEVEVSLKEEMKEKGRKVLQEILDKAGFVSIVSATDEDAERIYLEIKGDDMGRIIGKEGAALEALQIIVSAVLSKSAQRRKYVSIDAAGYKKKKEDKIRRMTEEAIAEALDKKTEVVLSPMSAADRRIVHIVAKEDGRVTTLSRGEGAARRVAIALLGEGEGASQNA